MIDRFSGALLALPLVLSTSARAQVGLEVVRIATGFEDPVLVTAPDGDLHRLFVVEQTGRIHILRDGVLNPAPFLDLSATVLAGGERGLLGLAFHPGFATNGRLFVNYTAPSAGDTRVAEYHVSGDPLTNDTADTTVVQQIVSIAQPFGNHNGGMLAFSPLDGLLYVGMGDGGSGGDPGNRAQDGTELLGKMLRFNVDLPAPFVDPSNPFVGTPGVEDAIWALGLRNPWRWSFDRLTGDLWIGDVGQGMHEEVDFEPAGAGGRNYGWRCMEGFDCTGSSGCTCNGPGLTLPLHAYDHSLGNCSVTGGYRYRGSALTGLDGLYFFADFCSSRIWTVEFDGTSISNLTDRTAELEPPTGNIQKISSFGEDAAGELYICDYVDGEIYKIVPACSAWNYCVTSPNSIGSGALMNSNDNLSIAADDFTIGVSASAPSQPGLFYYGPTQAQAVFGDGFRCVAGTTYRLNPVSVSGTLGGNSKAVSFTSGPGGSGPGQILPGSTWNFQYWYRDPGGPGGSGFNLSDGLSALFCP